MTEEDDDPQRNSDKSLTTPANGRKSTLPSTGFIETAIANISEEKKRELHEKAAEEAIELEKKRIELGIEREHADERIRSIINTAYAYENMDKDQDGRRFSTRRYKISDEVNTSTGTRKIEVKSGAQCFIATACFGPESEEVLVLKSWRDRSLRQSPAGRRFIGWYYGIGPTVTKFLQQHPVIKATVKGSLRGLVGLLKIAGFKGVSVSNT